MSQIPQYSTLSYEDWVERRQALPRSESYQPIFTPDGGVLLASSRADAERLCALLNEKSALNEDLLKLSDLLLQAVPEELDDELYYTLEDSYRKLKHHIIEYRKRMGLKTESCSCDVCQNVSVQSQEKS